MLKSDALATLHRLTPAYGEIYWSCVRRALFDVFGDPDMDGKVLELRESTSAAGPFATLLQYHEEPLSVAASLAGEDERPLTAREQRRYAPIQRWFVATVEKEQQRWDEELAASEIEHGRPGDADDAIAHPKSMV